MKLPPRHEDMDRLDVHDMVPSCTFPACFAARRCTKRCDAPSVTQRELAARLPLGDRPGTPCDCGSGLAFSVAGKYCVECSPLDTFCDDCPDTAACEFKCTRPGEPFGKTE